MSPMFWLSGAAGFRLDAEETVNIRAKSVILCTGAGGFKPNGFPLGDLTHDGTVMAYRIGAKVIGKEWNDGHTTRSDHPAATFDGWGNMFERVPSTNGVEVHHDLGVDLNYSAYISDNPVAGGPGSQEPQSDCAGGPYTPEEFQRNFAPSGEGEGGGPPPDDGAAFYGQDAQIDGSQPSHTDNGDGTVTDASSGLMWAQADNGETIGWEAALAFAQTANAESYLGHDDWSLPNIKALQAIVDYTRSPDTTNSPAIDPVFDSTAISNEAGQDDYGSVWSSTTHANWTDDPGSAGAYVSFGRAMGFFDGVWTDVHGAGAQRSDPKVGDPADFPEGNGPQGDAQRIYNFVRLVRDAE